MYTVTGKFFPYYYQLFFIIGCWEEEVVANLVKFMLNGNSDIIADVLKTLINGKNVQYVDKVSDIGSGMKVNG